MIPLIPSSPSPDETQFVVTPTDETLADEAAPHGLLQVIVADRALPYGVGTGRVIAPSTDAVDHVRAVRYFIQTYPASLPLAFILPCWSYHSVAHVFGHNYPGDFEFLFLPGLLDYPVEYVPVISLGRR